LEHVEGLNTTCRRVRYSVGWKMTDADETAIARPASTWTASLMVCIANQHILLS
jgi:hypothetical protein